MMAEPTGSSNEMATAPRSEGVAPSASPQASLDAGQQTGQQVGRQVGRNGACQRVRIRRLCGVGYDDGVALQRRLLETMRADPAVPGALLLVEHTPVVTLGRSGDGSHLRWSREELAARGIDYHEVGRGGDITYHGPGQWTVYPILRLDRFCKDLHRYMRLLEAVVIHYLAGHGIQSGRREGKTGVWVGRDKLAAVGVAVSRWVSWHGVAINIDPDLSCFTEPMTPCGIAPGEGGVTSLARCLGHDPGAYGKDPSAMDAEADRIVASFRETLSPLDAWEWIEDPRGDS